jgi:hypothetical protein
MRSGATPSSATFAAREHVDVGAVHLDHGGHLELPGELDRGVAVRVRPGTQHDVDPPTVPVHARGQRRDIERTGCSRPDLRKVDESRMRHVQALDLFVLGNRREAPGTRPASEVSHTGEPRNRGEDLDLTELRQLRELLEIERTRVGLAGVREDLREHEHPHVSPPT